MGGPTANLGGQHVGNQILTGGRAGNIWPWGRQGVTAEEIGTTMEES